MKLIPSTQPKKLIWSYKKQSNQETYNMQDQAQL